MKELQLNYSTAPDAAGTIVCHYFEMNSASQQQCQQCQRDMTSITWQDFSSWAATFLGLEYGRLLNPPNKPGDKSIYRIHRRHCPICHISQIQWRRT